MSTASGPEEAGGRAATAASAGTPEPGDSSGKPGIMGRSSLRSRRREGEGGENGGNGGAGGGSGRGGKDGNGQPSTKRSKNDGPRIKLRTWRAQRMTEDYVNLVGDMMYPKVGFGAYGYDTDKGEIPLERPNTLGALLCPVRRPTVIERWSPYEIACFEGAITLVGKNFYEIAKVVKTKSTKDVIEFYYIWKMTTHYQQWKRGFEPLEPHPFHIAAPEA